MKVIRVKKLWKGMIPLRAKYVDEAVKNKQDLGIIIEDKAYKLSLERLQHPSSEIVVPDYFGGRPQKLYYFKQSPKIEEHDNIKVNETSTQCLFSEEQMRQPSNADNN